MFRIIAVISMIMMPIVSVVSTDSGEDTFRSHDIFENEGCRPTCEELNSGPAAFDEDSTWSLISK